MSLIDFPGGTRFRPGDHPASSYRVEAALQRNPEDPLGLQGRRRITPNQSADYSRGLKRSARFEADGFERRCRSAAHRRQRKRRVVSNILSNILLLIRAICR